MLARTIFSLGVAASIAFSGLVSGCSSHQTTTADCVASDTWIKVPPNMAAPRIASALGVTADQVAKGRFGPADCKNAVPLNEIGTPKSPIVSVAKEGSKCLVIGTQEAPKPNSTTKKILAVCPVSGNNS